MSISQPPHRLLAIGDIHGYLDKLRQLLDLVQPGANDKVIFLGDYVDRGPDSRGVLDALIRFGERFPQTIFLRGNHEQMFMDALAWQEIESLSVRKDLPADSWRALFDELQQRADFFGLRLTDLDRIWRREGGLETIASFDDSLENVRPGHRAFLKETKIFHEERLSAEEGDSCSDQSFLFVHAGADARQHPQQQHPLALMNYRGFAEPRESSPWTVVHGHTIQLDGPEMMPKRINLDTGVYLKGGRLTCCDVLSRQVWQV